MSYQRDNYGSVDAAANDDDSPKKPSDRRLLSEKVVFATLALIFGVLTGAATSQFVTRARVTGGEVPSAFDVINTVDSVNSNQLNDQEPAQSNQENVKKSEELLKRESLGKSNMVVQLSMLAVMSNALCLLS